MSDRKAIFLYLLLFIPQIILFVLIEKKEDAPSGMVLIPTGEFVMGSDDVDRQGGGQGEFGNRKPWYLDEHPQHKVFLPGFFIDRYEVTNQEYLEFVQKGQRRVPAYWKEGRFPEGQADFPVVDVNWYEARDYCEWRGKRLPTEAEWEKGARGPNGNLYAWGKTFDPKKGNVSAGGHGDITAIGQWKEDRSAYGVYDMNGNVMEWSADWYQPFPGSDYQSPDFGEQFKIAKGDAFGEEGHYALSLFSRLSYRQNILPEARYPFLGIRCAKSK
jgi:formylglycine-generating enzyme required for sulfatase activity